ncbi:MAG TPA: LytR C-terminal domain-containing protein [Candidatus Methylomirabilis sp.]|nr:LytR C-terminal domain-containing protein [Candidatus Methylomirabilis sp.]
MPSSPNEIMKKLRLDKLVYPAITIIFILIVAFLFAKTIMFLTGNVNKVFSDNTAALTSEIPRLDLSDYELIRQRFGWPEITPTSSAPSVTTITPVATGTKENLVVATSTLTIASSTPASKALVVIEIFNTTKTSGLASALQKNLNQAGFSQVKTGNSPTALDNTTIQAKSASALSPKYLEEITQIVAQKYAPQTGAALADDSAYDVIIFIGKK